MSVKVSTINNLDIAVLELKGNIIGGEETDELKSRSKDLVEQGNKKLVIDLGGVNYINSSGLGALVSIHGLYNSVEGRIRLCRMGKGVQNVFVLTRLTGIFDVDETREDAIANI